MPPTVSTEGWGLARWAVCTISGALYALELLRRQRGGMFVARLSDAAYDYGRLDLADPEARKLIALALFMHYESRWTPWSKSLSGRVLAGDCMRGINQQLLAALIADPGRDEKVHRCTVYRYIWRGERARVWQTVQVPAQVAERWECGRTVRGEYARKRYWLCSARLNKPALEDGRDSAAEHERGWELVDHPPRRIPLRDRLRGVIAAWLAPGSALPAPG